MMTHQKQQRRENIPKQLTESQFYLIDSSVCDELSLWCFENERLCETVEEQ